MSVSPPVHAHDGNDGDRRSPNSPYFPRISGPNTIARPSPMQTTAGEEGGFPSVKLQAKMVLQTSLPYQTQEFRPCIVLKKFEPPVRVSDSFVGGVPGDESLGAEFKRKRTVILHTDRYSGHGQIKLESDSQKVRLQQEGQMLQDARSRMRLREALAHRARHDLHLGGNPVTSPTQVQQPGEPDDEAVAGRKKLDKLRRLKKLKKRPADQLLHQQPLAFITEELPTDNLGGPRKRRGGQLVSHSSAPSVPALHLGQQLQRGAAAAASFVSRSEFDALAALIGGGGGGEAGMGGVNGSGGLEKVKLDGNKAVFNRRSDILAELSRLKAIVLPDFAKDLYIGRGIRLPGNHALNHPRKLVDLGDDPVLDALLNRAQQPIRITDEAGNILISAGSVQQPRAGNRKVFAADVSVREKIVEGETAAQPDPAHQPAPPEETLDPAPETATAGHEETEPEQPDEDAPPLPEPYLGLSSDWTGDLLAARGGSLADDGLDGLIMELQLPAGIAGYLRACLAASSHARAGPITVELGRLIGQRLLTAGDGGGASVAAARQSSLIGWLRRGLDLFHDVDREAKGSVSLAAFFDILSSMRGSPLDEAETASTRDTFGLSGDSVSKLAFLTVLPFLLDLLNRKT